MEQHSTGDLAPHESVGWIWEAKVGKNTAGFFSPKTNVKIFFNVYLELLYDQLKTNNVSDQHNLAGMI